MLITLFFFVLFADARSSNHLLSDTSVCFVSEIMSGLLVFYCNALVLLCMLVECSFSVKARKHYIMSAVVMHFRSLQLMCAR